MSMQFVLLQMFELAGYIDTTWLNLLVVITNLSEHAGRIDAHPWTYFMYRHVKFYWIKRVTEVYILWKIRFKFTNNNNQKLYIFKSKIKTRCKIFLFLFLIFRLSYSILWKWLLESDSRNIRKRNKNTLHFVFILLLKMHSFWLLLFVIKLYSQINIFKDLS